MASEQPLFTLRPATTKDLPAIDVVADPEGMGPMPSADHITVAVNADDEVVGFLRLQEADGLWHVNPVAVYPTWRRFGVGQALMEDALAKTGELGLVARGPSVPFYEALGYDKVAWGQVGAAVAAECDGCPVREQCHPQPMRKRA